MNYRITVRYSGGQGRQRYHLEAMEAEGLVAVLHALADRLPEEVAATGDLVEIRPDVDPEARSYLGEEEPS